MAKRDIKIIYYFVSRKSNGADFTYELTIKADNEQAALNVARIEGFTAFGELFNDNCVDWRVSV